jgi:hypothetical protein
MRPSRLQWLAGLALSALLLGTLTPASIGGPAQAAEGDPIELTISIENDGDVWGTYLTGDVCVEVNWGDGDSDQFTSEATPPHTYTTAGDYQVTIGPGDGCSYPYLEHFGKSGGSTYNDQIVSVESFGDLGITSLNDAFRDATSLTAVPSTLPDTVVSLEGTFLGASIFNQDISGWLTPGNNVELTHEMFEKAYAFNQDLSDWDVSGVKTMDEMFDGAGTTMAFNQDLSNWDFSGLDRAWAGGNADPLFQFVHDTPLDRANYSALLQRWAEQQSDLPDSMSPGTLAATYTCAAETARGDLVAKSWSFNDGGLFLAAPSIDTVTPSSTSLSVAFTAPDCADSVTDYEYSTDGGSTWTSSGATSSPISITSLNRGQTFTLGLRAVSTISGEESVSVSATTVGVCTALDPLAEGDYLLLEDAESTGGGSFELTPDENNQKGAIWAEARANFSEDFCLAAEVYLGDSDAGADGMAFVIQPLDSQSLTSGGGLGYAGISPSFAVELDTYDNGSADPNGDHIALMKDGDTNDHDAWGHAPVVLSNIEDDQWRSLSMEWDASEQEMTVTLDGTTHFNQKSVDMASLLSDYSDVAYWGFTAATGGATNVQAVRDIRFQASSRTNSAPQFTSPPSSATILQEATTSYDITVADDSTTANQWQTAISTSNTDVFDSQPTFSLSDATSGSVSFVSSATETGSSTITLTITDADGATTSHSFTITVATELPAPEAPRPTRNRNAEPTPVIAPPTALQNASVPAATAGTNTGVTNPAPPPLSGPILRGTTIAPPANPLATIGGVQTETQTNPVGNTGVRVSAGSVNVGVGVSSDTDGRVVQNESGTSEMSVVRGGATRFSGSGLLPSSTVQVFLGFDQTNSTELARIPVDANGNFDGSAALQTPGSGAPLPIGRQVIQMVSVDEDGNQAIIDMPINIAQPSPQPEILQESGETPALRPGQSLATRAGEPVDVRVIPRPENKQTIIDGGDWSMEVVATGEGSSVAENADGEVLLELVRDENATISGSGFMPLTRADVWLFSEPTLLGSVDIDENGEFNGEFNIDGRVVTVGEHTMQLQGVGEDGYTRSANLGVLVGDDEAAAATTNASSLVWLWWLLGGLVLVAGIITGLWWRRRLFTR